MENKSSHLTHDVYDRLPPSHKVIISLRSARGLRVSWPAVSRPLLFSPGAKTLNKMRFHKLWRQLWNSGQAEMCLLEKQLLANNWCFPLNPHKEIVSRRYSFMKHSNAYKVSSWWSSPFEEKTTSKIMSSCLEFRAMFSRSSFGYLSICKHILFPLPALNCSMRTVQKYWTLVLCKARLKGGAQFPGPGQPDAVHRAHLILGNRGQKNYYAGFPLRFFVTGLFLRSKE